MKVRVKCQEPRDDSQYREANIGGSMRTDCKVCEAAYIKKSRNNRAFNLKHLYGMTINDYDALLVAQGSKCAICGCPPEFSVNGRLAVDHCHDSDKIRGLLCTMCNTALGSFKDSPALLRAAAAYVELH